MNQQEVAAVLAKIAVGDKRTVDRLTLDFWIEQIGDLDFQDCLDAVAEHFRTSDRYLLPVHVRQGAAAIKKARWAAMTQDERLGIEGEMKPMPAEFRKMLDGFGRVDA